MSEGDYVLGTRDDEVGRLGIQHEVWRDRMLNGLARAGIGPGQTIVDVGAGPGFVTAELSKLVGESGRVIALERSEHFLTELERRAISNVQAVAHDVTQPFPVTAADACWCRWLLSFAATPSNVVENIAAALRPGGIAIFHEYAAYSTWRMMPPDPKHERFRSLVEQSWRDAGGEPDVALSLPAWLHAAGLDIVATRTYADIVQRGGPAWEWPRIFMETNTRRLHELGYLNEAEAAIMAGLLDNPAEGSAMLTPLVAEIIARRR
jgi:SAM-dependent methyltransferase